MGHPGLPDGALGPYRLELDLDVNAGGKVETHERVDGAAGGVEDVDEALVGAHLELLAGVLVLVGRAKYSDDLLLGGKGDRAGHVSARTLGRINDLFGRLIDELVLVGLELDPDFLACHFISSLLKYTQPCVS